MKTDEQYFLGISEALKKYDPSYSDFLKTDCKTLREGWKAFFEQVPVPGLTADGVLYGNEL